MRNFKVSLLAATIVAGFASSQASAQVVLAAPEAGALHGAGASSIQNIVVRNFNCIGADQQLGKSSSATALSNVSAGNFAGTPAQDCSVAANDIQPAISGQYVSTGSGFGRTMWKEYADGFDGAAAAGQTVATGVFNPFGTTTRWTQLDYAFSDAALSQAELTTYNTKAAPKGGAAVTFPLYVLPVAIAYATTYGTSANGRAMVFNAQGKGINGASAINLTKAAYCGIFNGTITNWNDPILTALNKKIPLNDPINDPFTAATKTTPASGRWVEFGVPIRLVGRLDKSGTTDVFTRHLAAVCNAANSYTGTNKFLNAAETLPYSASGSGNADFRSVRSDTNYFPTVSSSKLAGTSNSVSGDYWTGSAIVNIGAGTPTSLPTGAVGSGLFLIADGGGKVASAIVAAPDYALGTGTKAATLNGKVGYISADFIQPSVDAPGGLNAAALQVAKGATFAVPTVAAALKGLATILPPESSATGAYTTGDTRLVTATSGTTKVAATRNNPLAWVDVLYADSTNTLADPQNAASYPITGTTQFFGYTCYKTNTRLALGNHLGLILGQVNKNSTFGAISKVIFSSPSAATPGIDVQANIGVVPAAWSFAIANTFLKNGDAGALNLYIQDAVMATKASGTVGKPTYKAQRDPAANSSCTPVLAN
jgi:ABC-type phosphate transport system substrate-binding protein